MAVVNLIKGQAVCLLLFRECAGGVSTWAERIRIPFFGTGRKETSSFVRWRALTAFKWTVVTVNMGGTAEVMPFVPLGTEGFFIFFSFCFLFSFFKRKKKEE